MEGKLGVQAAEGANFLSISMLRVAIGSLNIVLIAAAVEAIYDILEVTCLKLRHKSQVRNLDHMHPYRTNWR